MVMRFQKTVRDGLSDVEESDGDAENSAARSCQT